MCGKPDVFIEIRSGVFVRSSSISAIEDTPDYGTRITVNNEKFYTRIKPIDLIAKIGIFTV